MNFDSYIVSETKTAFSIPLTKNLVTKKTFKQKAFTLAETLITLSIIGVVAAVTVPTLMSNVNKHIYVTGLKKAYSNIQNAIKMAPLNYDCSNGDFDCAYSAANYGVGDSNVALIKLIADNTKVVKSCLNNNPEDCIQADYKSFRPTGRGSFITSDGVVYMSSTGISTGNNGEEIHYSGIIVDVNGKKGPNKLDLDVFTFAVALEDARGIKAGTVLPQYSKIFSQYVGDNYYWRNSNVCEISQINSRNRAGGESQCAGRVLEENAMNY